MTRYERLRLRSVREARRNSRRRRDHAAGIFWALTTAAAALAMAFLDRF